MISDKVNTLTLNDPGYPAILKDVPSTPKTLFYIGTSPDAWLKLPKAAVVGSRKVTPYGRAVTESLCTDLVNAGVVIVSGLAYGVDSIAHETALKHSGITVAILPTSLDKIYPAAHYNLAKRIIDSGGTIISEYPAGSQAFKQNFLARNRVVSGLSDIVLITQAAAGSGTIHTAGFALEQGKTVMAVPGNIDNPMSEGCNNLIKSGAIPVTDSSDILFALKIPAAAPKARAIRASVQEELVFDLISSGVGSQEELALQLKLDSASLSANLTSLEIAGHIRPVGNGHWTAR